jgi:HAMP domain-containing protein
MTARRHAPEAPRKARLPVWRRLAWRLGASFLLLTALGIFGSGLLQYRAQDRFLRESLGELLLNIARTGALLVDGDLHEVALRRGSNATPEYAALRATLRRVQETNHLRDPVYTLSHVDGDMARFAVASSGAVRLGEAYRLAPPIRDILRRVLAEGASGYTDIYVNEHGTWITAFAPVRNRAGQTVAALDVDFRADVYLARLAALRRQFYLHALAGAVLAFAAGVLLARRITRPVAQLSRLAGAVVEGDLTARVRVTARDEIGLLANVFHLMIERLHLSHKSLVGVLVRALEARGGEAGSLTRLSRASLAVADRLTLTLAQREALELGAQLHDIGEVRTPEALLGKPGPLTADERGVIEQHPASGVELLEAVPLLTTALDVVSSHHERWDGSGYPQGLRGEEIPVTARIFAVVDALDAMAHDRPHRRAMPVGQALQVVHDESGKQFDPRVVDVVLGIPAADWATVLQVSADGEAGAGAPASPGSPSE